MPIIKTDLCSTTFLLRGWVNWLSYLASALYKQRQTKLPFLGQHFYSIYRQTYYSPMSPIADSLGDICKCKQELLFFTFDYRIMPAKAAYCIFLKKIVIIDILHVWEEKNTLHVDVMRELTNTTTMHALAIG